jgi:formate dehydrogenase subunit gamma
LHAAGYLTTAVVAATGWWLLLGREGEPSPLARTFDVPDTRIHVWVGYALAGVLVLPLVLWPRGVARVLREWVRVDRGDLRWWRRWPAASFTGRFARHEGFFDPGQRIAALVMVGGLMVLTVTGIGMTILHGGPVFALLTRVHGITTAIVTVTVLGHVLVAVGVLPGYRGTWRAMHGSGRVTEQTARRLWPAWAERRRLGPLRGERADRLHHDPVREDRGHL